MHSTHIENKTIINCSRFSKSCLKIHYVQQPLLEVNAKLRDMEEKQRLLKERVLLIGQNLVSEREELFEAVQEIKHTLLKLKEDTLRLQESMQRMSQQMDNLARKEEVSESSGNLTYCDRHQHDTHRRDKNLQQQGFSDEQIIQILRGKKHQLQGNSRCPPRNRV